MALDRGGQVSNPRGVTNQHADRGVAVQQGGEDLAADAASGADDQDRLGLVHGWGSPASAWSPGVRADANLAQSNLVKRWRSVAVVGGPAHFLSCSQTAWSHRSPAACLWRGQPPRGRRRAAGYRPPATARRCARHWCLGWRSAAVAGGGQGTRASGPCRRTRGGSRCQTAVARPEGLDGEPEGLGAVGDQVHEHPVGIRARWLADGLTDAVEGPNPWSSRGSRNGRVPPACAPMTLTLG